MKRSLSATLGAVLALATSVALTSGPFGSARADGPTDPWGPYGWDAEHDRFHQPVLGTPIPDPAPLGAYDDSDFDGDGVPNRVDNCLLVANPGQRPADKPASAAAWKQYRTDLGPTDMLGLSRTWKSQHPKARFRDDAELGEACSGYNANHLRTLRSYVRSTDAEKTTIFRFLAQSGPMMGGATNPFPQGKPTSYNNFGSLPGDTFPSPTAGDDLAQNSDGSLATGNMTPSLPMCSGFARYADFVRWLTDTQGVALLDGLQAPLEAHYEKHEDGIGCNSSGGIAAESVLMHTFWAGKRLYTNAEGGRITNRFAAFVSENPAFEALVHAEPLRTVAKAVGLFPYADDPTATGQSRHGIIFRGTSYVDGRDTIVMDWRGFEAAWPLGHGAMLGDNGNLIYDECRAIQTGVYACTAVLDWKVANRRYTFQEGFMPWITKGPPTRDEYIAAVN